MQLVFVIDDSPTVRKLVQVALQRAGYRVMSFTDGVEAMRSVTQPNPHIPDVIFLDILLPKMDGFQVARYFKRHIRCAQIPIVMLTRSTSVVDLFKAKLCGVNNYMTKPFTVQDLVTMAHTLTRSPVSV